MRTALALVLAAAAVGVGLAASTRADRQTITVSVETVSGRPIPHALIAWGAETRETDDRGEARFARRGGSAIEPLRVEAIGYASGRVLMMGGPARVTLVLDRRDVDARRAH